MITSTGWMRASKEPMIPIRQLYVIELLDAYKKKKKNNNQTQSRLLIGQSNMTRTLDRTLTPLYAYDRGCMIWFPSDQIKTRLQISDHIFKGLQMKKI